MPSIFICYAHQDNESSDRNKRWLDRLQQQLAPLEMEGQVEIWSDKKLELGDDWHDKIQAILKQVKAAVLLVSPAFLESKYIRNSELPVLLKQAKEAGVAILPVILRQCRWKETTFKYPHPQGGIEELSLSAIQVPTTEPLNSLSEHEQDDVLYRVTEAIAKIVKGKPGNDELESRDIESSNVGKPVIPDRINSAQSLELNGAEIEEFQLAICRAYSEAELRRMLRTKLEIIYDDIAQGNTYQDRVFNLIENFEREGKSKELLESACQGKPSSPKLQQFYQSVINK
jgi:hypothetical protein